MLFRNKRQHSSCKTKPADYSKVSEEFDHSHSSYLEDNKWENESKIAKSENDEITNKNQE